MYKKLIVILVCAVCVAATVYAAPTEDIYYSKKHGLRITIPREWVVMGKTIPEKLRKETGGYASGVICIFKESSADRSPLIYLKVNRLHKKYTIQNYAEVVKRQNLKIRQANPKFDIVKNAHVVTINGRKFVKSITRLNSASGAKNYVVYSFLKGKNRYSIICSLPAGKLDVYKRIFDKTAASVKFEERRT